MHFGNVVQRGRTILVSTGRSIWRLELDAAAPAFVRVAGDEAGAAVYHPTGACADVRFMANEGLAWLPDGRLLVVGMTKRQVLRRELDGTVVVHSGLIAVLENEAQLATVLGHEIGHATHRHGYRGYKDQQKKKTIFGIGSMLAGIAVGAATDNAARGLVPGLGPNRASLMAGLATALGGAEQAARSRDSGQEDMFGAASAALLR